MTTDEQALRNAVSANPHDWTPRLVLADYLDDTGEPHHAEEAARIRQAADPSTPLGRAVAASRRAFGLSHELATSPRQQEVHAAVTTNVEKLIHSAIHHPNPRDREEAVRAVRSYHTRHSFDHSDMISNDRNIAAKHGYAAEQHRWAGNVLGEYARTL